MDTQTRMARLRECYPTDQALADQLGIEGDTVCRIGNGTADVHRHPDVKEKVKRHHEQIKKEHAIGAEAVAYALQTIERLKAGTMTDDKLNNVQQVLEQKAEQICDDYT